MSERLPDYVEVSHVQIAKLGKSRRQHFPDCEQALDLKLPVALRVEVAFDCVDHGFTEVAPRATPAKQAYAATLELSDEAVPMGMAEAAANVRLVSGLLPTRRRFIIVVQDANGDSALFDALGKPRVILRLLDAEPAREQ
ncbi:MAG: hypothetical protein C0519_15810 [Hyphomicrobium sp.]|nr:hypothetical protein [Hyphomicrobium sp.]PPD05925.1 MAG: hypothetical protein CTY28_15630 [Hyphomicrobium sp.]